VCLVQPAVWAGYLVSQNPRPTPLSISLYPYLSPSLPRRQSPLYEAPFVSHKRTPSFCPGADLLMMYCAKRMARERAKAITTVIKLSWIASVIS